MDLAYFTNASEQDLRQARMNINHELEQRARRTLELAAEQYTLALGADEGIETMAEVLCRHIAARSYSGGWDGIVKHMMKLHQAAAPVDEPGRHGEAASPNT